MPADTPAVATFLDHGALLDGLGAVGAEVVVGHPVGRGRQSVEHAGRAEQERAGADGRGVRRRLVSGTDPIDDRPALGSDAA